MYLKFFQLDKNGEILRFKGESGDGYLTIDSCRARRHECLYNHFSKKTDLIDINKTSVGIVVDSKLSDEKLETILTILNSFEDSVGLSKTTIVSKNVYRNGCYEYAFSGSYWWSIAPPIHSLYTLLIRFLTYNPIEDNFKIGDKDSVSKYSIVLKDMTEYLAIHDKITPLMLNLDKIFGNNRIYNYTLDLEYDTFRRWAIHYSGIQSFLGKLHQGYCPRIVEKIKEWRKNFKKVLDSH
jgi:hypothetical protein